MIELLEGFTGAPRSTFRVADKAAPFDYSELREMQWGEAKTQADIGSLLTKAPIPVDELIRQSGAQAAEVHMVLLELELSGELERHAGGAVSRL